MAVLPTLQGRAIPVPGRGIATIANAGAVGEATARLGQTVYGIGDQILDREAAAKAKERDAAASDAIRKLLYDPETGFMNLRGEAAVGARERTMAELDRLKESSFEGLNNAAKRKLEAAIEGRIERALGSIDTHTSDARRAWIEGAADARIAAAGQDALVGKTDEALAVLEQEIRGRAAREGWSIEETEQKLGEARSKVFLDQVTVLADSDPIRAMEYLKANADDMLPSDVARLESILIPEVKKASGRAAGAAAAGDWLVYQNQGKIRDDPLSDELTAAMSFLDGTGITMEVFSGGQDEIGSGGKRTGSTRHDHGHAADVFFYQNGRKLDWGNPDDIPILQGIVARARMAGLTGFGAGPGYMQQGSMHIGFGSEAVWGAGGSGANAPDWLKDAFANPEKYAGNVTGGPTGLDALLEIEDPLERDAALAEYDLRMKVEEGRNKAAVAAATQDAFEWVNSGKSVAEIPLATQNALGMSAMTSLRAYEKSMAAGTPIETDPTAYYALTQMMVSDPNAFRSVNMMEYVDKLSESDWKKMVEAQTKPEGSGAAGLAASTLMETANRQLRAAGIDTSPEAGDNNAKRIAGLQTRLLKWQEQFIKDNGGRAPKPEEIDARVVQELTPVLINDGWFGKPTIDAKRFEVQFDGGTLDPADDITPADLRDGALSIAGKEISNALLEDFATMYFERYGRAPTVEEMIDGLIATGAYK